MGVHWKVHSRDYTTNELCAAKDEVHYYSWGAFLNFHIVNI
jgi:hypothetical protein